MTASTMTDVLLAGLRCTRLRLMLTINDLDAVGIALKSGLISPEQAIAKIHQMGLGESPIPTTERCEAPEPREGIAA